MVWWIVAGLVVVPLLAVVVAAAPLRSRRAKLERLVTAARQQGQSQAAALQPGQLRLQAQLTALQQRAVTGQARAVRLKRRLARPRP